MEAKDRVKRLADEGIFGKGKCLQVTTCLKDVNSQHASKVKFFRVIVKTDEGDEKEVPIFVKYQLDDSTREFFCSDVQFSTEVTMYDTILPDLGADKFKIHPQMYYGLATRGKDPLQDFIVLEDLTTLGFKVGENVHLDYDHVSLAIKKLGQFHGLSYKLKSSSLERFHSIADSFIHRDPLDGEALYFGAVLRGFQPFLDSNSVAKKAYEKLTTFTNAEVWKMFQQPEEPFGVIAHGDFNRNNVLFKYDDDGNVVDVIIFDFASAMYADPAVDISFFMYMNISPDLRAQHWDDFLKMYWEGVTSVGDDPGFSFEQFLRHFAKRAAYGYFPSSFYLPMMLFPEAKLAPDKFLLISEEEKKNWGLSAGGPEATEIVAGIVQHLLDKGYLDDLDWCKST